MSRIILIALITLILYPVVDPDEITLDIDSCISLQYIRLQLLRQRPSLGHVDGRHHHKPSAL